MKRKHTISDYIFTLFIFITVCIFIVFIGTIFLPDSYVYKYDGEIIEVHNSDDGDDSKTVTYVNLDGDTITHAVNCKFGTALTEESKWKKAFVRRSCLTCPLTWFCMGLCVGFCTMFFGAMAEASYIGPEKDDFKKFFGK